MVLPSRDHNFEKKDSIDDSSFQKRLTLIKSVTPSPLNLKNQFSQYIHSSLLWVKKKFQKENSKFYNSENEQIAQISLEIELKLKNEMEKSLENIKSSLRSEIELELRETLKKELRLEIYKEAESTLDYSFAANFKKSTDSTWDLLLRNAKDGGANSVLAAKLLTKIVGVINSVNSSNRDLLNSSQDLKNITIKLEDISHQVKKLTDQSRMVSFNASIEAARAGEHGKTFAVVAEEINKLSGTIRELSQTTSESLELMEHKIEHNQNSCRDISDSCFAVEHELIQFSNLMSRIEQLSETQTKAFHIFKEKMDKNSKL